MGVYDDSSDFIKRDATDLGPVLTDLQKPSISRQVTPVAGNI